MADKKIRVIDVNMGVFEMNDRIAAEVRAANKANGVFMVNMMASPGSGKTTTLLRTIAELGDEYKIGIMEADIDASVDAEKMAAAGVRSIQIHTGGECCMDAAMTKAALEEFETADLDLLFMENVGNLVCTAEQDTGATVNVEILSIPEGDDKPLKYPLMFTVCQAVLVNKIDAMEVFDFDMDKFTEYVRMRNPHADIFPVSAETGEGFDAAAAWIRDAACDFIGGAE